MRTALFVVWAIGAAIALASIAERAFGAYGYAPRANDAIAVILIACGGAAIHHWTKR